MVLAMDRCVHIMVLSWNRCISLIEGYLNIIHKQIDVRMYALLPYTWTSTCIYTMLPQQVPLYRPLPSPHPHPTSPHLTAYTKFAINFGAMGQQTHYVWH